MERLGLAARLHRHAARAGHGQHHRAHGATGLGARQLVLAVRAFGPRRVAGRDLRADEHDAPHPRLRCPAGAARGDRGPLFERLPDLFGLPHMVTLYDLNNIFFEGEAAARPKAEHGHSREKRSDCPRLTLGLVLDGSGFVRRSEVVAGAVSEDTTLAPMLEVLHAPAISPGGDGCGGRHRGQGRLAARDRRPLSGRQPGTRAPLRFRLGDCLRDPLAPDGPCAQGGQPGRGRLYCYFEVRAKKEQGIAARFESALRKLDDGLSRPRTRKRLDHVWQRIGRIEEKSRGAGVPSLRFIPAWAGNASPDSRGNHARPVHPRVGGERLRCVESPPRRIGSSPRGRGTR